MAVSGGSAGGHLAALAALTGNDPAYQPGFEGADTAVQACLPLYGVHDLLGADGRSPKWPYLASHVLKVPTEQNPEAWHRASPIHRAGRQRPPFLVAHGALDSLVRPDESRRLVAALRQVGGPPVGYAEVPGATHGFDSMHSVRGERFAAAAAVLLDRLWAMWRAGAEVSGLAAEGRDP